MKAIKRDGIEISVGDTVAIDGLAELREYKKCMGLLFTVLEITPYEDCESGFLCRIHLKDHPDRILKSRNPLGIDVNWLTPFSGSHPH